MNEINNRNRDFLLCVEEVLRNANPATGVGSLRSAVKKAIHTPARGFYLTTDYAWRQLQERRRRLPPDEKPHRRAMWEELEAAYQQRRQERPKEDPYTALDDILSSHRPSGFFLSEEYAWRLVRNLYRSSRPRQRVHRRARSRASQSPCSITK